MSADEFQTKYASVMEGMLKSAVAETTKLFETMVDELKAEITRIKKENDDLKTRCSQFESSKNQQPVYSRCAESPQRSRGCSEKRDTAVQCELVPVRTVLVERCPQSSLQNEQQQWSNEQMQNGLWDHNYVTQESPRLAFILVKQEESFYDSDSLRPVLKQEEDGCTVSCGQVSNTGLSQTAVFEAEKEGPPMNQECSTGEMAQNHQEAVGLPSFGTVRAKNQSTEPENSCVPSLAASKAHMENASDGPLVPYEEQSLVIAQQQPVVKPLDKEQLSVVSLQCQKEGEISVNEQTDFSSNKQYPAFDSPKEAEQLAKPTPQNKEAACEALKTGMKEGESSSHLTCCRRGRPPKKGKQIEQQLKQSSSVQERENTALGDMENSNIGSLCVSVASLTKGCSFQKEKTCKSQQLSKEMEASSCEVSFANEAPNCATESQEASLQLQARRTSATIQDAMLLVDAMDQSSVENTYCSPKKMSPSPSTYCSPCVGILQTANKAQILTETPKAPDNLSVSETPTTHLTIPALSSSPRVLNSTSTNEGQAITTVSKGHQTVTPLSIATSISLPAPSNKASVLSQQQIPHFVIPSVATCNPRNPICHKIIVTQRSKPSAKSHEGDTQSQFRIPTLVSRFVDKSLPIEKPSFSSDSQKTRYVLSRQLLPVAPLKSTTSSTDQQPHTLPDSEISIINPRQVSAVPPKTHPSQTTVPANLEPIKAAGAVTASQLISSSQELHVKVDAQTILTANNVKSPIETACVSKTTNTHTETDSSLNKRSTSVLTGEVPASMAPKDQNLSAVVRLTRLPFSISTKESVSVSSLLLNGCLADRSSLRGGTAQRKLSNVATSEPLAKPVVSISMCHSLNKTSPSAPITISQPSTPPKTPTGLKKPSVAASKTEHPADERYSDNTPSNNSSTEEKRSADITEQTILTSKSTSDPHLHLQMSKTQFLAQLAVSPLVEAPAQASLNDFADTRASMAENGASDKKRVEQTSLVARLRSHLKTHCQSKQIETNPQKRQNGASPKNTESTPESLKKNSLTSDGAGHQRIRPSSESPKSAGLTREGAGLKRLETSAVNPRSSSLSENVTSLTMSSNESVSVFIQHNSSSLQFKTESSPLSPRSRTISVATKGKSCSPNTKVPILAKHCVSPGRTGESAPTKKPKLIQDATRVKKNFRLLNAKKKAITPKVKTIAIKLSKLQTEANTGQLAQDQTSCEPGKKYKVKSVWIPPIMPNTEAQSARGTRSSIVIVKKLSKSPRSQKPPVNDLPGAAIQATPSKTPTVTSPLQPLSVIGGRLLKNQCGECGRVLSSSAALESHVNLHTGLRPFSCTSCGKSFPDPKGLKRHSRVHRNGRIHTCHKCGKGFVYRFGLSKHLQMVHSRIKPFVCQICSKGFYTKRDVETHIRIHTGEKPFQCHLCEKKFTRRVELNVHLRWHKGEKRHWCPYCGKGFLDFNNLKRHKYIHTGEKPHSCPHCPKHFTQSGHLKKHVKNVHKTP